MQMLPKGFFRIEFPDAVAASNCRKLTSLIWGGRVVRLDRWTHAFSLEDPSTHCLGHVVRVQFPDLEPYLQEENWLRKLGQLLGEVFTMEGKGSDYKRPVGPIVNVLMYDIKRLSTVLSLPAFAPGAKPNKIKK